MPRAEPPNTAMPRAGTPAAPKRILHIDMDAFFAAIEQRDHPEWRGRPVIVGAGPNERGVVSTCSYEARRYGVHSAMPSREAARRCPHAVFTPGDMRRYAVVSRQVFDLFERFTPAVEPLSVDEAFLDVTGSQRLFGPAERIAATIRTALRTELGLTGSVGIARNPFLAKLASELHKPDGQTLVPDDPEAIRAFLAPLSVRRLWGVGAVTAERLATAGLRTIGDVQRSPATQLAQLLGRHQAETLQRLAEGVDERELMTEWTERSISRERTFAADVARPEVLRQTLASLADDVARRVRRRGQFATLGRLKLRWTDFRTITRQRPLVAPACDDFTFRELALALFESAYDGAPIRLVGFGVTQLVTQRTDQLELFDDRSALRDKRERVCQALDGLRERFGPGAVSLGPDRPEDKAVDAERP